MSQKGAAYFISDLHLGARYAGDTHTAERRVNAFFDSIKADAAQLYLVGDILDYWYEYRNVVPRGYVRFFGKLAELSDAGVKITWLIGNHDIWIFDYLPQELGIEVVDGYVQRDILGSKFFISHGDGIGKHPRYFRMMRGLFRNRLCQRMYSALHPRLTVPLALAWSNSSRVSHSPHDGENGLSKPAASLLEASELYLSSHPGIRYFVYGHLHEEVRQPIANSGAEMIVLGDWLSSFTYARFDGDTLTLQRFHPDTKK